MALRRYVPLEQSRGTTWPTDVKRAIHARDDFRCVSERAGLPVTQTCWGAAGIQADHVRASHGTGMKSASVEENGVSLCPPCHRWKTENGRVARPLLLAYLDGFYADCGHVDPVYGCPSCDRRGVPA